MKTVDNLAAKQRLSNTVGETASGHTAGDMLVPNVLAYLVGRSLAGIAGSNPSGRMDVCLFSVLYVVLAEASATDRSLVQGSPTVCVCVCMCVHTCDQKQQRSIPRISRYM